MSKDEKRMKRFGIKEKFLLICFLFCVSAMTPILVPFSIGKDGNLNIVGYITGALFWFGLVAGSIVYMLVYRKEKVRIQINGSGKKFIPGLCFFSNPPAKVMDIVLVIGIIGTIFCSVNLKVNQFVAIIFLVLLLTGVYAHFLLNGKVYQYIWNYKKENKKTSELDKRKE